MKSHEPFSLHQIISPDARLILWQFRNTNHFLKWGVVSTSHKRQSGWTPLVCCPRLLIRYIRSYPSYRRPFLHSQTESAPHAFVTGTHLSRSNFNICKIFKCHGLTLVGIEGVDLENDVTIVVNCYGVDSHTRQCCKSDIIECCCLKVFVRI